MWIKAKIDTGARTSAIHARNVTKFVRNGQEWVRFTVLPWQSSTRDPVELEARLEDQRWIRSSNGQREFRPVVLLPVHIAGVEQVVEFTLSHRPQMGFRVLIGRQALRGHFQVDPAQSYLGERPPDHIRLRNKTKPRSELTPTKKLKPMGPKKLHGTATSGTAKNGTAKANGAAKNGTAKANGVSKNGTSKNGTAKNGTAKASSPARAKSGTARLNAAAAKDGDSGAVGL